MIMVPGSSHAVQDVADFPRSSRIEPNHKDIDRDWRSHRHYSRRAIRKTCQQVIEETLRNFPDFFME